MSLSYYRENLYCPVCKVYLGARYVDQMIWVHCVECKATFKFNPYDDTPTATIDKPPKRGCNCGRCGR